MVSTVKSIKRQRHEIFINCSEESELIDKRATKWLTIMEIMDTVHASNS